MSVRMAPAIALALLCLPVTLGFAPLAPRPLASTATKGLSGFVQRSSMMRGPETLKRPSARSSSLVMHIGHHHHHGEDDHDHDHHGHSHGHHHPHGKEEGTALVGVKGLVQYVLRVIARKKQTIAGVLLGAVAVVGVRTFKGVQRVSKTDLGVLCVVATFVLAVETTKSYLTMLSRNFSQLVTSWKHHWSLRQLQRLSPETAIATKLSEGAREADRVTWLGIYVNVALFVIKFAAGFVGHSAAMIADAGHTLSDLVSDAVTLWAVRMSSLPPDADHPWGHGRFEAVGSLGVSVLLLMTSWHIAIHAYDKLQHSISLGAFGSVASWTAVRGGHIVEGLAAAPTLWAVGAALASIIVKELLYQKTASVGLKHNSPVLIANAWHHRSDAISSIMALGGILAARAGLAALDPLAGILVTAMIGLTGMQIFSDSISQLTDTVDSAAIPRIQKVVDGVEGVMEASNIRARRMGPQMLVDLLIRIDCNLSASAAQHIAEQVRWRILRALPAVSEVLVHTKTEPMPCPVASELRPPSEIEQETRFTVDAMNEPHIRSVPRVTVHYIQMQPTVEVLLQVDPALTVDEASAVAARVRQAVETLPDVMRAEVHLDLTGNVRAQQPEFAPKFA